MPDTATELKPTPIAEMSPAEVNEAIHARDGDGKLVFHARSAYGKELREAWGSFPKATDEPESVLKKLEAKKPVFHVMHRNQFLGKAILARANHDLSAFSAGSMAETVQSAGQLYAAYIFGCGATYEEAQEENAWFKSRHDEWEKIRTEGVIAPSDYLKGKRAGSKPEPESIDPVATDESATPDPGTEFAKQRAEAFFSD